jgi:hypothetical protein
MDCRGPWRITGAEGMTSALKAAGLEQVLTLADDRGWPLFPCAERGKTPLIGDWPRRASSHADVISRWAKKHERCNWAVPTGPASGVFAIDVDGEVGENSFCALVELYGTWSQTLTAITGRGRHFYFDFPASGTIRNSSGKLGAGIDVRGDGGYCIIPPSTHPSGAVYEWNGNSQVATAADWLLKSITSAARPAVESNEIGILPEGRRNDGLTRLAGAMRRRGKSRSEIEYELLAANLRRCRPPLSDDEVMKIAASVARYAAGGLDPLEAAWQATQGHGGSNYERFLALAAHLQEQRPGQAVALPLERIASLLRVHWNSVGYYRSKAVASGILHPAGDYIPHRRAGLYRFSEEKPLVTSNGLVTKSPSYKAQNSPSYKQEDSPLVTKDNERENSLAPQSPKLDRWTSPIFTELRQENARGWE